MMNLDNMEFQQPGKTHNVLPSDVSGQNAVSALIGSGLDTANGAFIPSDDISKQESSASSAVLKVSKVRCYSYKYHFPS